MATIQTYFKNVKLSNIENNVELWIKNITNKGNWNNYTRNFRYETPYGLENVTLTDTSTYQMELRTKNGFTFSEEPLFDTGIGLDGFTLNSDKTIATSNEFVTNNIASVVDDYKRIIVSMKFVGDVEPEPEPEPEPEQTGYKITVTGEGFKILVFDSLYQEIATMVTGDNFLEEGYYQCEIILDDGYIFKSAYKLDVLSQEEEIEINFGLDVGEWGTQEINVNTEYHEEPPPEKEVTGFNHLYLVDKEILKSIASERFITGGGSTTDLGTYIINVLEIPFKLDDTLKGLEDNISLGYVATNTKAVELIKDEIILDLGIIFVPNKFNNSYDYMNTVTRLHLPFTNTIDLDINYVIGYEINVKYIIDLYYGDVTINVSSSKIDNIIHSETAKIGRDIPFIRKYSGEAVNSISTKNGVNNGLLKPFIEVIRNIPYEQNNIFKNEVITHEELKNVTGFITVNNIILNSSATQNEKTTITNLLRSGVYIK